MLQRLMIFPCAANAPVFVSPNVMSADAPSPRPAQISRYIRLSENQVFGRSRGSDVCLPDPSVSRRHLEIRRNDGHFVACDMNSQTGSRLNGLLFAEESLTYGDVLSVGPFMFRFDGLGLQLVENRAGAALCARGVTKSAGGRKILDGVSLDIPPGEFVGILGTSGAGKSTLLDALSGIRPASSGSVLLDGQHVRDYLRQNLAACGYVPQDDIVHLELTVRQAIAFGARLRLPRGTPALCVEDCVDQTIRRLGLAERAAVRVSRLSGGQRKRVSIAAEVLSRPAILFLDEPSSGLDPATEFKLMEQLRELANLGCTVICTTHVMENVFLFDRLLVMAAGHLIFSGSPEAAREHFGIERFALLYERIESQPVAHWRERFQPQAGSGSRATGATPRGRRPRRPHALPILLQRQWAVLTADWKNLLLLLGQPLLIGSLVAWMSDSVSFKLFLSYLATFWFGCSNAAQEIVKEASIFRRERVVGVGRVPYLGAKFLFWSLVTCIQAMLLFVCIHFGPKPLSGSPDWQTAALMATALSAVAVGFALSAWVKSTTQAVMLVPLILLPQIIFSGFVLPDIADSGPKKIVSEWMPSFSSQRVMDSSLLLNEPLSSNLMKERALELHRLRLDNTVHLGDTWVDTRPAKLSLSKHAIWVFAAWIAAWIGLLKKERVS